MDECRVLSIQSHTVHGHVGNKAAVFPLQLLGLDVDAINSIQLSNHAAYPVCRGKAMDPEVLDDIISGLRGNGILQAYSHLLTGYTRSPAVLERVAALAAELRTLRGQRAGEGKSGGGGSFTYLCDPVLGDNGRLYVPEELVDAYRTVVFPHATVITPNQFEAEILTGMKIDSEAAAARCCGALHALGPPRVVLTGLAFRGPGDDDAGAGVLRVMASQAVEDDGGSGSGSAAGCWVVTVPRLPGTYSGAGDLFASQLLGHLALGPSAAAAPPRS